MTGPASFRRRDLLKTAGAAGCALGMAAPGWSLAAPAGFVCDIRFPDAFRPRMPLGTWRHEIDGDVTALWRDRLDRLWRTSGPPLGGVTGEDALFVLEHLAWDRSRRVVHRRALPAAHGPVPLVRWLIADRRMSRA